MFTYIRNQYRKHKKLKYFTVVCILMVYLFRLWIIKAYSNDQLRTRTSNEKYFNETISIHEPKRGAKNIFFLETTCINQTVKRTLNPRQACAVESAAATNKDQTVYVLHTCAFSHFDLPYEDDYLTRLLLYPNVRFLRLNITRYVEGTVVEDWWNGGGLDSSSFPIIHASDVLRLLTLWKYGGTYLDLDFVMFKSLSGYTNFIGAESKPYLANGMMNFEAEGVGHDLVHEILEEMKTSFESDIFASIGPLLVTRMMKRRCNATDTPQMTIERCNGITVLPPSTFYPIPWAFWLLYFAKENPITHFPMNRMTDSLGAHVWNCLSKDIPIHIGSNRVYGLLAERYCPNVYYNCGPVF